MGNDLKQRSNDFSAKKQWPQISNQLFDQAVQRCFFLGALSWGALAFAFVLSLIHRAGKIYALNNVEAYSADLYAFVMTGASGVALFGVWETVKAGKFAYNQVVQPQDMRRMKLIRRKVLISMAMCVATLFVVFLLMI